MWNLTLVSFSCIRPSKFSLKTPWILRSWQRHWPASHFGHKLHSSWLLLVSPWTRLAIVVWFLAWWGGASLWGLPTTYFDYQSESDPQGLHRLLDFYSTICSCYVWRETCSENCWQVACALQCRRIGDRRYSEVLSCPWSGRASCCVSMLFWSRLLCIPRWTIWRGRILRLLLLVLGCLIGCRCAHDGDQTGRRHLTHARTWFSSCCAPDKCWWNWPKQCRCRHLDLEYTAKEACRLCGSIL